MPSNFKSPLVSIICLCYNHEDFIIESLNSLLNQKYKALEIIIVNDKSADNSHDLITKWISENDSNAQYIVNTANLGNTKSFNKALKISKGDYVIDFATDDILLPNFISDHIQNFENTLISNAGVSYSNVQLIENNKTHINYHFPINRYHKVIKKPKSGNLFNELLASYYLNPTGMFVKREVYTYLNGYDENLQYEDFDFWIRSSKQFSYIFCDSVTVQKRIHDNSLSSLSKVIRHKQIANNNSTFLVCKKAYKLCSTQQNYYALIERCYHELKIVTKRFNFKLSFKYTILYILASLKVKLLRLNIFN